MWTDPRTGTEYERVSGVVIVGLVAPFVRETPPSFDEEVTEPVEAIYGDDLSTHPVFEAMSVGGYCIICQWPEVAAALVQLPPDVSVSEAIETLPQQYEDIEYVQSDFVYCEPSANRRKPTDDRFDDQWGFDQPSANWDVDAPEGWWYDPGGAWGPTIAVIDTGVVRNHPDLSPRLTAYGGSAGWCWRSVSYQGGAPVPSETTQWVHGTNVAGVLGAVTNNSLPMGSIAGGNWGAPVFPVQVQMHNNKYIQSAMHNAYYMVGQVLGIFRWYPPTVTYNIRVLNMSYGLYPGIWNWDRTEARFLYYFLSRYMVCCAAAGNEASSNPYCPVSIGYYLGLDWMADKVLGVGATTRDGYLWAYSNHGSWNVDVSAPGEYILTTSMGNQTTPNLEYWGGTSLSCPFASALASLLVSAYPGYGLTPDDAYWRIITTRSKPRNNGEHNLDPGKVNYYKAIRGWMP